MPAITPIRTAATMYARTGDRMPLRNGMSTRIAGWNASIDRDRDQHDDGEEERPRAPQERPARGQREHRQADERRRLEVGEHAVRVPHGVEVPEPLGALDEGVREPGQQDVERGRRGREQVGRGERLAAHGERGQHRRRDELDGADGGAQQRRRRSPGRARATARRRCSRPGSPSGRSRSAARCWDGRPAPGPRTAGRSRRARRGSDAAGGRGAAAPTAARRTRRPGCATRAWP